MAHKRITVETKHKEPKSTFHFFEDHVTIDFLRTRFSINWPEFNAIMNAAREAQEEFG